MLRTIEPYFTTALIKTKDLGMGKLAGLIQMGPKCHYKCLCKRDTDTQEKAMFR